MPYFPSISSDYKTLPCTYWTMVKWQLLCAVSVFFIIIHPYVLSIFPTAVGKSLIIFLCM